MNPLGIDFDPLITSGLVGFAASILQAAADRPEWTPARRRMIALALAAILGIVVWYAGAYPLTWRLIATQASVIAASAATSFTILKQLGVIDWVGQVTPGGEEYVPKHAAGRQDASTE